MSACDTLVDLLEAHLGFVPLQEFNYRVAQPSKYLASHLWRELQDVVGPCMTVKKWLTKTVRMALGQNIPLEWTSPSGLPMRIADRMKTTTVVQTMLYGTKRSMNMADAPLDAKLDATLANKAVCANFTHQMDAAFLTLVTDQLALRKAPVLVNHDCFATTPGRAGELHNLLLTTFSGLYRTDWLAVFREEMQARTGLSLPKLPDYGELCPGEIGTNPYIFS
jgi:DNA-directed RNA polymerase